MKKSIDFLIILLMTVTAFGAVDKIEKKLNEVVLQHKKVFEVPGVAVGILKDNKVLYAKGFGVRSLKTNEPLTNRSLFHMAFDILADVIARASGMTFEAYMKKNIFTPLEMKDSTFYKPEVPKELATAPHVVGDLMGFDVVVSKIYPYNRFHAPSSTLHSNVMDMFNWATANFDKGEFKGRRILKADTHERLWKEHVKISWHAASWLKNQNENCCLRSRLVEIFSYLFPLFPLFFY